MKTLFLLLSITVSCYGMEHNISYGSFIIPKGNCDQLFLKSQIGYQLGIRLRYCSDFITVEHKLSPEKVVIKKNKENFTFGNNDRLYVFVYGTIIRIYIDKENLYKNSKLANSAFSQDIAEQFEYCRYPVLYKIHKSARK